MKALHENKEMFAHSFDYLRPFLYFRFYKITDQGVGRWDHQNSYWELYLNLLKDLVCGRVIRVAVKIEFSAALN